MLKEESNILIYLERRKFRRKREKTENSDYLKKKKITSDFDLIAFQE